MSRGACFCKVHSYGGRVLNNFVKENLTKSKKKILEKFRREIDRKCLINVHHHVWSQHKMVKQIHCRLNIWDYCALWPNLTKSSHAWLSLWLHFFSGNARTAFFIRETNNNLWPSLGGFSIYLRMYVFVTKIIIFVVVFLGNLPLPNALGPACYYDWPQSRPKG
jgi:hypothetical protein